MDELVVICKRCGQSKPPHSSDPHLCEDCVKAENSRVSHFRQHNQNWLVVAEEAELNLWDRQPGETDREYQVWLAYRDAYPSVKPSYRLVAEQLATTINVVKKVGQRWDFPVRLQAWAKYVDELTLQQRRKEIVDMNARHVSMSSTIQEKLKTAIENIDPYTLDAKDIQGLFKLSTEIERKARLDETDVYKPQVVDSNPELKEAKTDINDLNEVVQILAQAGVLGGTIGVKKTTTTEVVVKGGD